MNGQGENEPLIVRITEEGLLDESFGNGGVVELPFIGTYSNVIVDENDNIYTSGRIDGGIHVIKLLEDGEIDTSFGDDGVASALSAENEASVSIDLDANGNIFVFAIESFEGHLNPCVIAFDANGETLTSFAESGKKIFPWPGDLDFRMYDGLIINNNQRLYIAGNVEGENGHGAMISVDLQGNLVQEFGDGGFVEVDAVEGLNDGLLSLTESEAGLYMGIEVLENAELGIISSGVALFDYSGSLRDEFAENGVGYFNFTPQSEEWSYELGLQSDGKVILAGAAGENSDSFGYVSRLLSSPTINVAEIKLNDFTLYPNPATHEIRLQSNGQSVFQKEYKIFNLQGQQVSSGRTMSSSFAIDVSDLPQGAYQILIGNETSKRFFKVD